MFVTFLWRDNSQDCLEIIREEKMGEQRFVPFFFSPPNIVYYLCIYLFTGEVLGEEVGGLVVPPGQRLPLGHHVVQLAAGERVQHFIRVLKYRHGTLLINNNNNNNNNNDNEEL